MPSCCVPGCKNYYQKGFSLYSLPADPVREALWIANIGRHEWTSAKKWFICGVHFAANMWEKPRVDGKQKLKHNAVPTIFNNILTCDTDSKNVEKHDFAANMWEKPRVDGKEKLKHNAVPIIFNNILTCDTDSKNVEKHDFAANMWEKPRVDGKEKLKHNAVPTIFNNILTCDADCKNVKKHKSDVSEPLVIQNESDIENLKQRLQLAEFIAQEATAKLEKAHTVINRIEKSRRMLKKHVRRLIDEKKKSARNNVKSHSQLRQKLNQIFNNDQIEVLLGRNSRGYKWSNNTILKALQLRFACGSDGYNELLNHLPLPSERTLRRTKKGIHFD